MSALPENTAPAPLHFDATIEQLLADVECEVEHRRSAYEAARTVERRILDRLDRARRAERRRSASYRIRTAVHVGLAALGTLACAGGGGLLLLGHQGGPELLGAAGAAWSLAAAVADKS
ncbi:hypothetical protein ACIBEA_38355 [Streptomyces sp. NPDC051555]|uniref:hypothetical protein n=1 Tax=Streptomyces sp. NPDC051555 TaxID=3365657 RepID=UPI00378B7CEE